MKNTHLFVIDPQNDFTEENGALYVPGANPDMTRLSSFIRKNLNRFGEIHCSLDSHQSIHIAHPIFWLNLKNEHPAPFTIITREDVQSGTWKPFHSDLQEYVQRYMDVVQIITIWPPHCIIGSWGHMISSLVSNAFIEWEITQLSKVNYIMKGMNYLTEQYSAVKAVVENSEDISTHLNTQLIEILSTADEILIAGEAVSHCVNYTVVDIADNIGEENIKKLVLLTDVSSNVLGCEKMGQEFLEKMVARGMRFSNTIEW